MTDRLPPYTPPTADTPKEQLKCPNLPWDHIVNQTNPVLFTNHVFGASEFAPKLTEHERLGILAAHAMGTPVNVLAAAFNVNRRTIGLMTRPSSTVYRKLRKKAHEMGRDALIADYYTNAIDAKVKAALNDDVIKKSNVEAERITAEREKAVRPKVRTPNPRADRFAGDHSLYDSSFKRSVVYTITFGHHAASPFDFESWYWVGDAFPDDFVFDNMDTKEPFYTSVEAYNDIMGALGMEKVKG